ncbi:hypothetical protein PG995_008542 [Apiospora arundinis]
MKGFKFCHHLQDSQEFWGPQPAVHGLPGLQMLREWWHTTPRRTRSTRAAGGNGLRPNKTDVDVEIVTYHQLGAFRTPQDWMWRAFTERTTEFQQEHMSFLYAGHAPGSVKKRWERGVAAKRKQIRASGKTSA